jgi:hypothetical protein
MIRKCHNFRTDPFLTERLTKGLLSDFQEYVRKYGKPCGECQKAFWEEGVLVLLC